MKTLHCEKSDVLFKFSKHRTFKADLSSDYYSFKFLSQGKESYLIEDRQVHLFEHQLVITRPHKNVEVSIKSKESSTGICIYVHPHVFEKLFGGDQINEYLPDFKFSLKETSLLDFYSSCSIQSNPDHLIALFSKEFSRQLSTRIKQTAKLSTNNRLTKMHLWERMELSREFILQNYSQQLQLQDIAAHACLSPFYFLRSFKQFFGISPTIFLRNHRMKKAHQFFRQGLAISDVALRCGYEDVKYFKKVYDSRRS